MRDVLFISCIAESAMAKMEQILCSDWLPERARKACLSRSGFPTLVPQEKSSLFWPYSILFIDQACLVKVAGYWPVFLFCFVFCFRFY